MFVFSLCRLLQVQATIMERISIFRGVSLLAAVLEDPVEHSLDALHSDQILLLGNVKRRELSFADLDKLREHLKAEHNELFAEVQQ